MDENIFLYFYEILVDNLKHPNADIQKDAVDAFQVLFSSYDKIVLSEKVYKEISQKLKDFIKMSVYDESVFITKGFTAALPFFKKCFVIDFFKEILEALFTNSKIKKSKNEDSDTRKFAIESLFHMSSIMLNSEVKFFKNIFRENYF